MSIAAVSSFSVSGLACARNGHLLFSGVNFSLTDGQMLHICGENGVGKTTLLRCLAGLSLPYAGTITWQGQNTAGNEAYKAQLRFLGHKQAIKSALTLKENLRFSLAYPNVLTTTIDSALAHMGLATQSNLLGQSVSAGQRQRAALASLLLATGKLWLLDEPFTALDQDGFNLAQDLMLNHVANQGIIIFTSHLLLSRHVVSYQQLTLQSASLESNECIYFG